MSTSYLTLVKARFSKDSRIDRSSFYRRLGAYIGTDQAEAVMPGTRSMSDAFRWGINHALRNHSKYIDDNGDECRVLITPLKGKEFRVQVDIQKRASEVNYTSKIATLSIERNNEPIATQGTYPTTTQERDIWSLLRDAANLVDYGRNNLFETDLRRITDTLLDGKILKLWPGIYAALGEDSLAAVEQVKALLACLNAGEVRISILSLENSVDNRKALADELADEFSRAFDDINGRAGKAGPNVELLEKELSALQMKRYTAEKILGCSIPCDDSQADAEMALLAIS